MKKKVLSILVDNTSGVLSRISGLFSRRGYNIDSLTVGETENAEYSRMTVVVRGDDHILDQIEKQLAKLEDNADKETAIELLLSAKGFDSSVVTVSDTNVDAVINVSELSDTDKAQIEDIIKRKTGFAADKITINICNN